MDEKSTREGERITEEAAAWVDSLENASSDELAALAEWLTRSPIHVKSFLLMTALDRELSKVDPDRRLEVHGVSAAPSATTVPIRDAVKRNSPALRHRRRVIGVAAAIGALAIALPLLFTKLTHSPTDFTTSVGEHRAITLEDGSVIHLNTQSRVRVNFANGLRDVLLVKGEALFVVERDPNRPFRVLTDTAVVRAVGTKFSVYRRDHRISVSVTEGRVQILAEDGGVPAASSPDATTLLVAGEEAEISRVGRDAKLHVRKTRSEALVGMPTWTKGLLWFSDETLADVVAEFNRYNHRQLVIADPAIATLRVGGAFETTELESFVAALQLSHDIRVVPSDSESDSGVIRLFSGRKAEGGRR